MTSGHQVFVQSTDQSDQDYPWTVARGRKYCQSDKHTKTSNGKGWSLLDRKVDALLAHYENFTDVDTNLQFYCT